MSKGNKRGLFLCFQLGLLSGFLCCSQQVFKNVYPALSSACSCVFPNFVSIVQCKSRLVVGQTIRHDDLDYAFVAGPISNKVVVDSNQIILRASPKLYQPGDKFDLTDFDLVEDVQ